MNLTHFRSTHRIAGLWAAATIGAAGMALATLLAVSAPADMYRPQPNPGGIDVRPAIVGPPILSNGTNVTLNFKGMEAPYEVQMSPDTVTWTSNGATALKWPNYTGSVTVSNVPLGTNEFFRMNMLGQGTNGVFGGALQCNGCHGDNVTDWSGTGHATAYLDLTNALAQMASPPPLSACVVCHSVGYGQPGGFTDTATTPHLANVGCEACHGTAGAHINISGRQYRPVATLSPELCGGCHSDAAAGHPPTYDEYTNSPHFQVLSDVSYGISSGTFFPGTVTATLTNNVTNVSTWVLNGYVVDTTGITNAAAGIINSTNDISGLSRQMSCGPCHSGATRMAMLNDYEARQNGYTNQLFLPSPTDGAAWGPTCANCHDPHSAEKPKQLRNPMRSTNYFTFFTATPPAYTNFGTNVFGETQTNIYFMNDGFASQYNPNVQICAQCHNSRGARWDGIALSWDITNQKFTNSAPSFSRGPHYSPQYNMLIGILQPDYLNTNSLGVATNYTARHGTGVSSRSGNYNTNQCATCHVPIYSTTIVTTTTTNTTYITGHTFELDINGCALGGCHLSGVPNIEEFQTTTTNSIAAVVALLNQWATNKGPALFTTNYANYGMNAWEYNTIGALAAATNAGPSGKDALKVPNSIKQARFNLYMVLNDRSLGVHNPNYAPFLVQDASDKVKSEFKLANFRASATTVVAGYPVTFTNLGVGATSYSWDFGDGNLSTSTNPVNIYASAGVYTVSLTATGPGGPETLTFNNYIAVSNAPVADFTAGPATSGTPPLTVYFTNLSAYATGYIWTFGDGKTNTTTNPSNTYTNAGTYTVTLKARNLGVTNTLTRAGYIIVN